MSIINKYFHSKRPRKPVFSSEHVSWRERLGEDAYVGWAIIVSISFLTAVALIALAGWLFFLIESGGVAATTAAATSTNQTTFDEKSLEGLIASFDAKASTTAALEKIYDGPPDPSQ